MEPPKPIIRQATTATRSTSVHARAVRRFAAAVLPAVFLAGTALSLVVTTPSASAVGTTWYAYAEGSATFPITCPKTTVRSEECTLAEALANATAAGTVELANSGSKEHYVGNWVVNTGRTSSSAPLTIKPAPGVTKPVLDGNHGKPTGCQTKICDGAVLNIGPGVHVDIDGVTIQHADNAGDGGAIDNARGGVLIVSASTFSDNSATDGGAIDNGDRGAGILTVSASTFSGNAATADGGAIDSADKGSGILTVSGSTFSGNAASADGGAIDSADNAGGGLLTVTASTFYGNDSSHDGGAIDSGDRGSGTLTVSASTFSRNTAHGDGGAIDTVDGGRGNLTVSASTFSGNAASADGGAIDNADNSGEGTLRVTVSTFAANTSAANGGAVDTGDRGSTAASVSSSTFSANGARVDGPTIDNSDNGGTSTLWVAADIFNGSCDQPAGDWSDEGYNVGNNATCLNKGNGDVTSGADQLGSLALNGGPTKTILPLAASPAVGVVPYGTTATLDGSPVKLCPVTDQRGVSSAAGQNCNAGAVQPS